MPEVNPLVHDLWIAAASPIELLYCAIFIYNRELKKIEPRVKKQQTTQKRFLNIG